MKIIQLTLLGLALIAMVSIEAQADPIDPIFLAETGAYSVYIAPGSHDPAARSLYMNGPSGWEEFAFSSVHYFDSSAISALFLNLYGQLIASGGYLGGMGEEWMIYAIYGQGDNLNSDASDCCYSPNQPGRTVVTGNFGSLGFPFSIDNPDGTGSLVFNPYGFFPVVLATGLDDDGTAYGEVKYSTSYDPRSPNAIYVPYTWQLGDLEPVPELSTLALLGI
jgi:hypothetical protein